MSETVLKATGIEKTYLSGDTPLQVLQSLDLEVSRGSMVAVVGNSGCGKSTLLQILGGLRTPDVGKVELMGSLLSQLSDTERTLIRRRHLGFLYQFHYLLRSLSAAENIALPLRLAGARRADSHARALQLLEQVGLAGRADALPRMLSGGECQRVALARALAHQPDCLLLDEPTGNLDQERAESVCDLLYELCRSNNLACVVVTHDTDLASRLDKTYRLEQGLLSES